MLINKNLAFFLLINIWIMEIDDLFYWSIKMMVFLCWFFWGAGFVCWSIKWCFGYFWLLQFFSVFDLFKVVIVHWNFDVQLLAQVYVYVSTQLSGLSLYTESLLLRKLFLQVWCHISSYFQSCSASSFRLHWSQSCFNITCLSWTPVFTRCARCGMMHRRLQRGSGSRYVATMWCRELLALPFNPKESHDGVRCVHVSADTRTSNAVQHSSRMFLTPLMWL